MMRGAATLRQAGIVVAAAAVTVAIPALNRAGPGPAKFEIARADLPPMRTIAASAPGRVVPITDARDLAATVAGRITYAAPEGQKVAVGDLVAEIDNADLRARLAGAEAAVTMRQSELTRLLNGAREEERHAAEAAVAQSQAEETLDRIVLQRRLKLVKSEATSSESVDRARADYNGAVANTKLLAAKLALLTDPPRPEDVAIAQANLKQAEANVQELRAEIEKTQLRSPVNGFVLRRYKSVGETVTVLPPTLIATVGDISRLRVRADLDGADVAKVKLGQRAWVTADAYGSKRFPGVVSKIGTSLGPKRIRTDDPTERMDTQVLDVWIDLDGQVQLPVGLRVDVFFTPMAASGTDKVAETR